jgi:hypothetical protein
MAANLIPTLDLGPTGPVLMRWESATRYYAVTLQRDLLGDWVLTIARGGRTNRLGAVLHKMVADRDAGALVLEVIDRRRRKRGYLRVPR